MVYFLFQLCREFWEGVRSMLIRSF
ncbi:unnamed protein product, partial [Rotaria magnacalcarata]